MENEKNAKKSLIGGDNNQNLSSQKLNAKNSSLESPIIYNSRVLIQESDNLNPMFSVAKRL